jgi:hypothetical protein
MENRPNDPVRIDTVQQEIAGLVKEFQAAERHAKERVPGYFRIFCLLAGRWNMDDEEFRGRLVRAGLPASRASEIKTVLSVKGIKEKFIKKNMSWKPALLAARASLHAAQGFDPTQELASEIVALMHRNGLSEFEHPQGTLYLHPLELRLVGTISNSKNSPEEPAK